MPVPGLRIGGTPPAFARTRRSGWSLPPGRHQACALLRPAFFTTALWACGPQVDPNPLPRAVAVLAGAADHLHPTAAHAHGGRPRRAEHGGGPLSGAPPRWRWTARPYSGPAAPFGGWCGIDLRIGWPGRWRRERKRKADGPPFPSTRPSSRRRPGLRRTPRPRSGEPGWGISADRQRQPTAFPPAAGAPPPRGCFPSAAGDRAGPRPASHPPDAGVAGLAQDGVPVRPAGSPAHAGDGAASPMDPQPHRRTVTEVTTRETVSLLTCQRGPAA